MRLALAALLALAGAVSASAQASGRIVAIGDIHGNLEGFVQILQQAKLIDASRNWSGGNATLVQTGDSIDRGPGMRPVLDLLMALEKQAPRKGGRVVVLLGNHEAMNVYGDLRYVTPENYASFADANSEKRREKAWKEYVEWRKQRAAARKQPASEIAEPAHQQWLAQHPLGFFEHRDAFGPLGIYGKWLRERPAILATNDTAFMHGGLSPELAGRKLEDLNKRIHTELRAFDSFRETFSRRGFVLPFFTLEEIAVAITQERDFRKQELEAKTQEALLAGKTYEASAEDKRSLEMTETFLGFPNWLIIHPSGPLWFRGYATWADAEGQANLQKLAPFGVQYFVVGHTPQLRGQITVRFEGHVFLIDTGMLASYYQGGVASALEINGGKFTAIYPDRRVALNDAAAPRAALDGKPDETLPDERDLGDLGGGIEQNPPAAKQDPAAKAGSGGARSLRPGEALPPLRIWFGPDGNVLPFKSDEEILEFLRTAEVKSMKRVGEGITHPYKAVLEKDGLVMHAIFRDVDEEKDQAKMADGKRELFFRDSYIFEIAAYRLSKMLALDNVPPAVRRKVNGMNGSLQIWVENAFTETKRQKDKIKPADVIQWNYQVQTMHLFDALVYNIDRNMGNVLIDKNWKLWMIDHTRAFRRYTEPKDEDKFIVVDRELYEALQALNPNTLKAELKDSLRTFEIEGLIRRREKLLEYIRKLVAEKGEDKVLFTWVR